MDEIKYHIKASLNGNVQDFMVIVSSELEAQMQFSQVLPSYKINKIELLKKTDTIKSIEPFGYNVFAVEL